MGILDYSYKRNNDCGRFYIGNLEFKIHSFVYQQDKIKIVIQDNDTEEKLIFFICLNNSFTLEDREDLKYNIEDVRFEGTDLKKERPYLIVGEELKNISLVSYKNDVLEMVAVDNRKFGAREILLQEYEKNEISGVTYDLHKYVIWK